MKILTNIITIILVYGTIGCTAQQFKSTSVKNVDNSNKNYNQKNILFIAVDDLKPMLNAYGETYMKTPNFDRLAKMGTSFTNAHVQQAVCGPSRASVMTAMNPDKTKVWDLHTDFRQSAPKLISMPEYLISQGYETTAIGKIYHKGSTSPGHDGKSWSIPHSIPKNYDPKYGDPIFEYYQDPETKAKMKELIELAISKGVTKPGQIRTFVFKKLKPSTENADVSDEAYQDGIYTVEAIKRLQSLAKGNKPFFLGVGYQKPHLPFVAPKKYWDLYERENIKLADFKQLAEGTPMIAYHSFGELRAFSDIDDGLEIGSELPEEKQRELIHGYMASISFIDAQIGKLLDELQRLNLLENTVIVLWGDHGYHLGDHTLWNKHSNFEQATRIPFMFAGPNVPINKLDNYPVNLVDLFPTVFELAGVNNPGNLDGKSLVPLFDNSEKTIVETDFAISQYPRGKENMGYSLRTTKFRYTEWHGNGYRSYKVYDENNIIGRELYDYENDPLETKNLVEDPSYTKIANDLKEKLKMHLQSENKKSKIKRF